MPRTDFHEEKMHDFYYKQGELYCDKARVSKILKKTGTSDLECRMLDRRGAVYNRDDPARGNPAS